MNIVVYVKVNAQKEKIEKISDGQYKVWVKEKPKNNKANLAVANLLSKYFHTPHSLIKLSRGAKSKQKVFEITK